MVDLRAMLAMLLINWAHALVQERPSARRRLEEAIDALAE